jgi:hypothetical protein
MLHWIGRDAGDDSITITHCQDGLAVRAPIKDTRVLRTYQERRHDLQPSNTSGPAQYIRASRAL